MSWPGAGGGGGGTETDPVAGPAAAQVQTNLNAVEAGLGSMAAEMAGDYLSKAGNLAGLANAVTALANLGGQALSAKLTAIAALTGAADRGIYFTAAEAVAVYTLTSAARTLLAAVDAAAQRTALGLGTAATHATGDYQPVDAELTALAGLTSAADKVPFFTGSGAAALADLTTFARTLLAAADATALLALLGVSSSVRYSYDWTASDASEYATDMLGGAMTLTGWADATAYGGDRALTSAGLIEGGKIVKLVFDTNADMRGWLTVAVAGDFCYALRFALRSTIVGAGNHTGHAYFVFVDGVLVDVNQHYGAGIRYSGAAEGPHELASHTGLTALNYWDTMDDVILRDYTTENVVDVMIVRIGTDLSVYWSAPFGRWKLAASYTGVSTLAGLIGLHLGQNGNAATYTVEPLAFKRWATPPL